MKTDVTVPRGRKRRRDQVTGTCVRPTHLGQQHQVEVARLDEGVQHITYAG